MTWQGKMKDIYASGLTQKKIAEILNVSQPWVNAVLQGKRGRKVDYNIGMAIDKLHNSIKNNKYISHLG